MSDRLRIAPFAGIRFNPDKIADLTPVISPPYDMIPPALQDDLRGRDGHNMVRLILPRDREGAPRVAVVNQTFARHYFGEESPVG